MRVTNKTKFITEDLREMARSCAKFWDVTGKISEVVFAVMRKRTWYIRGECSYLSGGKTRLTIWLPRDSDNRVRDVAITLEHEMDHIRGVHHNDMVPDSERTLDWLNGGVLRHKDRKPNPDGVKLANAQRRYALAVAAKKKAESNLKRAWSVEDKWKTRVTYYEKKLKGGSNGR